MVIAELNAIQKRFGYVTEAALYELSRKLNKPVHELYGVASFYPHYRLVPPPKATIHVCTDAPCHVAGAPQLLKRMVDLAGEDASIEVKGCSCLGQCDGAPAVFINDQPFAKLTMNEMLDLARRAIAGEELEHQHLESPKGPFRTDPYESPEQHYGALKELLKAGGDQGQGVIDKMKAANLRGMGGAGTPAFRKWQTVRDGKSTEKYVVCNGDECEVGTFKDRELMRLLPHLLVESMTIAGMVTGAPKGYVYIRHEYHEQIERVDAEIARAVKMNACGENIFGSGRNFDLEVFVSPGGYVQGEETALLEAIEGKRGQPRNKQWDVGLQLGVPAFKGLFGQPTIINNVETFIYVPVILKKGPEWFVKQGINGCQGLKWIGVGGAVARPGVFEVPLGTTYAEAIKLAGGMAGGKKLKAVCPSGPSFPFLTPDQVSTPMDFSAWDKTGAPANPITKLGTTVGSAAIIVLAEGTDMVDFALNMTKFYRNESCGKCVPCRVGSQKMVDIITGIMAGTAQETDLDQIKQLGDAMNMASICGLGQVVANPISQVLTKWKDEIDAYLRRTTSAQGSTGVAAWAEAQHLDEGSTAVEAKKRGV